MSKEGAHGIAHGRHAGGAAHHDHALDLIGLDLGIAQHALDRTQGFVDQGLGQLSQACAGDEHRQHAARELAAQVRAAIGRELFFHGAGGHQHSALVLRRAGLHATLSQCGLGEHMVHVVATQSGVATGGHDLEHALTELQQRDVEGAATQVIHRIQALGAVVQAVGNGRRRGLVEQAQHVQAGHLRSVFGGLALGIIKVGWHGDDRAKQIVVEGVFSALAQLGQDLGRHLDGRLHAGHGVHTHHAGLIDKLVGQLAGIGQIGQATTHEALDRHDGVQRVFSLHGQGLVADLTAGLALRIQQVTHGRGQDHAAIIVGQAFGHPMAHGGHERVGGAQVDAHGHAAVVRIGRLPRFRNLQQGHSDTIFVLFEPRIHFFQQAVDEHQGAHFLRGSSRIGRLVQQLRQARQTLAAGGLHFIRQRLDVGLAGGLFQCFTPHHLLHEEIARHGRVALGLHRGAAQFAQVSTALERVFQALVGLVHAHRPLHGDALCGGPFGGKAVRVYAGLQGLPGAVQLGALQRKAARQAQQGEVVSVDIHGRSKYETPPGAGLRSTQAASRGGQAQTRKDSPQPQRSRSLGLLNLNPSLRPSRTKSSWVPSM